MIKKGIIFFPFIFLVFASSPTALRPQNIPGSGAVKVKTEFLSVYSANSPKSEIVKILKKGDIVWVQMEIIGAEDKWCVISWEGRKEFLGFVDCRDLEYLDHDSQISQKSMGKEVLATPSVEEPGVDNSGTSEGKENISYNLGRFLQAVWNEDIFAVKELIEKGVNPNAQTKDGTSPLHIAAKKEDTEITNLLIASGADVNSRDQNGMTALIAAASEGQGPNAEVLLSAGADINAMDDKGFTALMWATYKGFPEVVEILLEFGAEVNARSKDGRTALWFSKKLVANTSKSLASAFKSSSDVSELKTKLANHKIIFQMLKQAGGRE